MELIRYKNIIKFIDHPDAKNILNDLNLTYLEFIQEIFPQKIDYFTYARRIKTNTHTVYDKLIIMEAPYRGGGIIHTYSDSEKVGRERALVNLSTQELLFFNHHIRLHSDQTIIGYELATYLQPILFDFKIERSIQKGIELIEKEIHFYSVVYRECLSIKRLVEIPEIKITDDNIHKQLPNIYLK